jgi:hypothetical protein
MDDVDGLIGLVRDLVDEVFGAASALLAVIEIERVHRRYVAVAVELLADAEAQCVLAAGGDRNAPAELARIAGVLTDLRDEARAEAER